MILYVNDFIKSMADQFKSGGVTLNHYWTVKDVSSCGLDLTLGTSASNPAPISSIQIYQLSQEGLKKILANSRFVTTTTGDQKLLLGLKKSGPVKDGGILMVEYLGGNEPIENFTPESIAAALSNQHKP